MRELKEGADTVVHYAMYTVIYYNDLVRSAIEDLQPFIEEKGSPKAKQIYKALVHRVNDYKLQMRKNFRCNMWRVADMNLEYDNVAQKEVHLMQVSIANVFRRNGILEWKNLSMLETCVMLIDSNYSSLEAMIKSARAYGVDVSFLDRDYKIKDIDWIVSNLHKECFKNVITRNPIILREKKSVITHYNNLVTYLCSIDTFKENYAKAKQYEDNNQELN